MTHHTRRQVTFLATDRCDSVTGCRSDGESGCNKSAGEYRGRLFVFAGRLKDGDGRWRFTSSIAAARKLDRLEANRKMVGNKLESCLFSRPSAGHPVAGPIGSGDWGSVVVKPLTPLLHQASPGHQTCCEDKPGSPKGAGWGCLASGIWSSWGGHPCHTQARPSWPKPVSSVLAIHRPMLQSPHGFVMVESDSVFCWGGHW
jgi:hypothetical protein